MKMKLKNRTISFPNFKGKIFTKKNYFIFLISLFIISVVVGIIFFIILNNTSKNELLTNFNNDFSLKDDYHFLNILFGNIKNNFFNTFLIWVLGISVVGCFFSIFLYFMEGFSLGVIISTIIYYYKYKGIFGIFLYLFPGKIFYIIAMFLLTYFSILFSYELFKNITIEKQDLHKKFNNYLKILFFVIILMLCCSILDTFITPFMIKAFTFLMK